MTFDIILPSPTAPDVVSGELMIVVGAGGPNVFTTLPSDARISNPMFIGADGETVSGTFVFIDDAGNRSQERTFSFVLADTIPPPQPGEVGLVVTGE